MLEFNSPIQADTLKDVCVDRLEELILSGKFEVGKRLPSQRALAQQLGVSRPVVHEALVYLANKGLVEMVPRVGAVVNDYREKGTLALLDALFKHRREELAPELHDSLLALRFVLEMEWARLAALNRTEKQIRRMREIIAEESDTDPTDVDRLSRLGFDFHHTLAMATDNPVYPLMLNSFKNAYLEMSLIFHGQPKAVPTAIGFQRDVTDAIRKKNPELAVAAMRCMLEYVEECLANMRRNAPSEAI